MLLFFLWFYFISPFSNFLNWMLSSLILILSHCLVETFKAITTTLAITLAATHCGDIYEYAVYYLLYNAVF